MRIVTEALWAPSPGTTRGQPTQLSVDKKGERLAYASNKSIFVRSIDNPALSTQYTAHTAQTTVARFAPSGFYIASGDVSGSVRVWDCVGPGSTKGEYHIISGRINDIAWDGDSQRIIAVGDGKNRFGHCITADSGNSVGEISGHSSQVNSVSIRQQRPLRAATGSDDTSLVFYHGAPFKFNTSLRGQHNNYVYGVAFSPDGSNLVSVGADRKVWLYDGKTGEANGQVGGDEHKGSIFGVSWAEDSRKFVTASADQTVKLWDVEAGKPVQSWRFGEEGIVSIPEHQVGVVWPAGRSDGLVISLSLNGDLNYLSDKSQSPIKKLQGHQGNITATVTTPAEPNGQSTIWTGSYDGRVCGWDTVTGAGQRLDGESHTNRVAGFAAASEDHGRIYSIGWDDSLRSIDASANTFTGSATKTSAQPRAIASMGTQRVAIATASGIEIFEDGTRKLAEARVKFTPTAIAATNGDVLAVGGDDNIVRIFATSSSGEPPELKTELPPTSSAITCLAYSPKGTHLAAGTSSGKIIVYSTKDHSVATDRWSAHTGRVASIQWNDRGTLAVSGGLDTHIFVWSLEKPGDRVKASNAHKEGINGVAWVDGEKVVSVGVDAAVKLWKVEGMPAGS